MHTHKLFLLMLLSLCFSIKAQEGNTEWKKMIRYYNCENYSMDMKIKIIPAKQQDQIISYAGHVKRAGDRFLSSVQGITTVVGEKYNISVNEHERVITYSKIEQRTKPDYKKNDLEALIDSASKNAPKIKSKTSTEIVYLVNSSGNDIYSSVEVTVSLADSHISKIVYHYRKSEDQAYDRVEIDYNNVEMNKVPEEKWFSSEQYFTIKKDKPVPGLKYSGYKVIDQQNLISSSYEK